MAARGEIPYAYMLYSELGDLYVGKQRFTDAADSYRAFVDRYPNHERAPLLQMQAIEAYKKGGFAQLVLDGKKEFVERYRLGSPFWAGRTPAQFPLVARELKTNLTDLAQYYHAEAQRTKKKPDYHEAARWYREFLQSFPDDPESARTNYLLAETLFESEEFRAAATEYERTAYAYPFHDKSAEAGYAALVCYEREAKSLDAAAAAAWNRQRLESQQRFAVTFPAHPESATLLSRTAREYYDLKDLPKALEVAGLVLARQPPVDVAMQRTAWTVTGNAQFDTGRYADAEGAYLQVQSLLAAGRCRGGRDRRAARGLHLQAGRGEAGGRQCRGRGRRLPARRQARAGRLDPRDGGVRRGGAAGVAQGLAARDPGARGLPRRLPGERAPGRHHAQPRARIPRGRAHGRGRRRVRAHRGLGRGDARGAAQRAVAGGGAVREVVAARAGHGGLRELRRSASRRRSPEALEARHKLADHAGKSATTSAGASGSTASSPPIATPARARTDRSRYLAARRDARAHVRRPATRSSRSRWSRRSSSRSASKKSAMERALAGYQPPSATPSPR